MKGGGGGGSAVQDCVCVPACSHKRQKWGFHGTQGTPLDLDVYRFFEWPASAESSAYHTCLDWTVAPRCDLPSVVTVTSVFAIASTVADLGL